VQPIYITNRNARAHAETLAILDRLGVGVPPEHLLCADATTKSNKDSRRASVFDKFQVLLLIGDNLRDFDDCFRLDDKLPAEQAIAARKAVVDSKMKQFGTDWILLPNPAYGEWNKVLGKGKEDLQMLGPEK
jgi:5'-nucleotidase (lipoprotein e(P4) family)